MSGNRMEMVPDNRETNEALLNHSDGNPARPLTLVEQRAKLERDTQAHIQALLKEREDIAKAWQSRDAAIGVELKALGYKRPRSSKGSTESQSGS